MTTVQMPSPYEDSVKCAHLHIAYDQCVTYCTLRRKSRLLLQSFSPYMPLPLLLTAYRETCINLYGTGIWFFPTLHPNVKVTLQSHKENQ